VRYMRGARLVVPRVAPPRESVRGIKEKRKKKKGKRKKDKRKKKGWEGGAAETIGIFAYSSSVFFKKVSNGDVRCAACDATCYSTRKGDLWGIWNRGDEGSLWRERCRGGTGQYPLGRDSRACCKTCTYCKRGYKNVCVLVQHKENFAFDIQVKP
jgi:hypothetical protein